MPYLNSTSIDRAEYEARSQDLTIWFRIDLRPHVFLRVPPRVYQELIAAISPSIYFARSIEPIYRRRV